MEHDLQMILAEPGVPWILAVAVFVGVFALVAVVGLRILSPRPPEPGQGGRSNLAGLPRRQPPARPLVVGSRPVQSQPPPEQDPTDAAKRVTTVSFDVRTVLRTIYLALSAVMVTILLAGAILAYLAATPGNGLLLVSGMLAVVAFITFLGALNFDRRMERRADVSGRAEFQRGISNDLAQKVEAALRGGVQVQWDVASPKVYQFGEADLARARTMLDQGQPIDEICRALDSGYDGWSEPHQRAYQGLIRAAIDHSR